MTGGALRFGTIAPSGLKLRRSGVRWLLPDGCECRIGQLLAYCNIALSGPAAAMFADEAADLQIALASPVAGRLRHGARLSRGGYVDRLPGTPWDPGDILCHLEGASAGERAALPLYLAGRRFSSIAEDRAGLLTGWHDRVRAWWGEGVRDTLLAMGTCEQGAILKGSNVPFEELAGGAARSLHVVLARDEPLVPNARTCLERLDRGNDAIEAIRRDAAETFTGSAACAGSDWLFVGALLRCLEVSPLEEHHPVLDKSGARLLPPARHLSLSLGAEFAQALRHRRLGYTLNCHHFRLAQAGGGVRDWLRSNFEPIERSVGDVRADLEQLLERLAGRCTLFVVNMFSSQSYERMSTYHRLDPATWQALGSVRAKQLNLMLHELARDHDLHIVDQDAVAAELGMAAHVPDGTHPSGRLNGRLRDSLLTALTASIASANQPIVKSAGQSAAASPGSSATASLK